MASRKSRLLIPRAAACLGLLIGAALPACAHAPLLDCYLEDGSVKCEAGFSDGTSAAGRKIHILDASHKVLFEGVLDDQGVYTFKPPAGDYQVIFEGGDNHQATRFSSEIS